MNYIIFDLEWNQGANTSENRVEGLPFEIVEIGAVKLSEDREIIGKFSRLVKPTVYHEMHYITSRLVHLKMEELEKGDLFPLVMEEFLEWCGEDPVFCTWGTIDLPELQRNMEYYGMEPLSEGPIPYLDIQKLFSLAYEDGKSRRALEYAIDTLCIKKDIPFHRAFSDAYYTAKVFDAIEDPEVLEKKSFDVYHLPKNKAEEVYIRFTTYDKYISRVFPNKTKLLATKDATEIRCCKCGRRTRRIEKWYTFNNRHYLAISFCFRHGFMKSKLRIRKGGGGVYSVKTNKLIGKEDMKRLLREKAESEKLKKN